MHKAMLDAGLSEPVYETDGMFTVTLRRPVSYKNIELTNLQLKVIQTVKKKSFIDNGTNWRKHWHRTHFRLQNCQKP